MCVHRCTLWIKGFFFFYQDGGIKVTLLCELNKFEFPPGGGGVRTPLRKDFGNGSVDTSSAITGILFTLPCFDVEMK